MKTIMLATGVKTEQNINDNIIAVYSPYMNFSIYNWSITEKLKWSPFKKHTL